MRNFGKNSLDEIKGALAERGLSLPSEAEKYRLAILAEVEKIHIDVPVLPWPMLISRARDHYHALLIRHNKGPLDPKHQGEAILQQIALNYLCSLYEAQYQRVYYTTLAVEAPSLLRARVLHAIATVYPQLSDAAKQCAEQERKFVADLREPEDDDEEDE